MSRTCKVEFTSGNLDKFVVPITSFTDIQQSFWANDEWYEANMLQFIKDNYKGGTFVDIGASIGNHSLYFSQLADTVYSFEPVRQIFRQQSLVFFLNKIENVKNFNVALGNTNSIKNIYSKDPINETGGGQISTEGDKVVVCTLDSFNLEDVKLIKIDAEQYESEILEGAQDTIRRFKPDIFMECADKEELDKNLGTLQTIAPEYQILVYQFNNTPTFLFTTKQNTEFNFDSIQVKE